MSLTFEAGEDFLLFYGLLATDYKAFVRTERANKGNSKKKIEKVKKIVLWTLSWMSRSWKFNIEECFFTSTETRWSPPRYMIRGINLLSSSPAMFWVTRAPFSLLSWHISTNIYIFCFMIIFCRFSETQVSKVVGRDFSWIWKDR